MTHFPAGPFTCDAFDALLPDLLDGNPDVHARQTAEAHAESCARCRGLLADLTEIRDEAAGLPVLRPSRDLWDGIAARIEAPAIAIPSRAPSRFAWLRLAAAAVVLVAATALVTWSIARQDQPVVASAPLAEPVAPSFTVAASYDGEIAELRRMLEERPQGLDSATARVLALNLRVIDNAIARVRAALDSAPSNAVLRQQLVHAYDMKVSTLRQVAALAGD